MITKINAISLPKRNYNVQTNSIKQTFGTKELSKANYEIKPNEIRFPNLLDLDDGVVEFNRNDYPEKIINSDNKEVNNPMNIIFANGNKTLKISKFNDGVQTKIDILNDDKIIGKISVDNNSYLPRLTYKQGKFKPEITVKHDELNGSRIKMLAGSELKATNFSIKMPGSFTDADNISRKISFAGKNNSITVTTLHMEDKTRNAVNIYLQAGLADKIIPGAFIRDVKKYEPNAVMPAGGHGQRYANISRDNENKPSTPMPTNDAYRVMGSALNMFAAMGKLTDSTEPTDIQYISQKNEIKGANVVNVQEYKNDGGAIADALTSNDIDNKKDTIILNADIFTNADITRAYHALKTLPNAALVIPYYPVNAERAKSFGLIGMAKGAVVDDGSEKGTNAPKLNAFLEKPKYTDVPPTEPSMRNYDNKEDYEAALEQYKKDMIDFEKTQTARLEDGSFAANPGMYVMSKEATEILKNMKLLVGDNKLGLGADVMPKIVELCNKGLLKNENGEAMKAYTMPLQRPDGQNAFWDDIGSAEAFLKVVKDVARETKRNGTKNNNKFYGVPTFVLEDFATNTDLTTGIVYQSAGARAKFEKFQKEVGVESIKGNIYIVD